MDLEDVVNAVNANTEAVKALTAKMGTGGAAPPAAAAAGGRGGRPKKVTFADVKIAAEKVVAEKSRPAAVALIRKHGAESLAGIDEAKYPAFIAAVEVLLNTPDDDGAGEVEPDDSL